jgi:hypothetical protein
MAEALSVFPLDEPRDGRPVLAPVFRKVLDEWPDDPQGDCSVA